MTPAEEEAEEVPAEAQEESFRKNIGAITEFIDSVRPLLPLFGINLPGQPPGLAMPGRLGSVPPMENPSSEEEKAQRIGTAITTLAEQDPKLLEHLEKLATIAATNPRKFKGLLQILDIT